MDRGRREGVFEAGLTLQDLSNSLTSTKAASSPFITSQMGLPLEIQRPRQNNEVALLWIHGHAKVKEDRHADKLVRMGASTI